MATLIAGSGGLNFDTLLIADLLLGDVVVATATTFILQDGIWRDEFTGSFTYANGSISGGTATAWKQTESGATVFEVTGFSVPANTIALWSSTNANETARSTILADSDLITGSAAADRMYGYTGADTLIGGGGLDYLRGNEGNDSLSGGDEFDDLHGNAGDDVVVGGAGDDWVVGGQGNDVLYGDNGIDIVLGNLGADTCYGGEDRDVVRGGQGDDVVYGYGGSDYVSGDRGNDTVYGGAGADFFHGSQDAGVDRVMDFSVAEGDRVMLDPGTTYTVSQVGADVVVDMGSGHQMILVGVQLTTLPSDWIFSSGSVPW
jgi:serralysin